VNFNPFEPLDKKTSSKLTQKDFMLVFLSLINLNSLASFSKTISELVMYFCTLWITLNPFDPLDKTRLNSTHLHVNGLELLPLLHIIGFNY
jgi:hypothetical protein